METWGSESLNNLHKLGSGGKGSCNHKCLVNVSFLILLFYSPLVLPFISWLSSLYHFPPPPISSSPTSPFPPSSPFFPFLLFSLFLLLLFSPFQPPPHFLLLPSFLLLYLVILLYHFQCQCPSSFGAYQDQSETDPASEALPSIRS